jgi:hypothetical protein
MEALFACINNVDASIEHDICLSTMDLLFLFEYRKITKTGDAKIPYAYIERPEIQILKALSAKRLTKESTQYF